MSKKFYIVVVLMVELAIHTSCSNTKFASAGARPARTFGKSNAIETQKPLPEVATASPASLPNTATPAPDCPKVLQKILVIDLKSGWWSGDGGDFFSKVLSALGSPCSSTITFEYHHITKGPIDHRMTFPLSSEETEQNGSTGVANFFLQKDFNSYAQIWVLSGSTLDDLDLPLTDPTFTWILGAVTNSKANLFLGAGNGAVSHSQAFAQALLASPVFSALQPEGEVTMLTSAGVSIVSSLSMNQQIIAPTSALFAGGIQSIADTVRPAGGFGMLAKDVKSDKLVANAKVQILANNSAGSSVIGISAIPDSPRKLVLDAGIQRFYAITSPEGKDTLAYMRNIIMFLNQ